MGKFGSENLVQTSSKTYLECPRDRFQIGFEQGFRPKLPQALSKTLTRKPRRISYLSMSMTFLEASLSSAGHKNKQRTKLGFVVCVFEGLPGPPGPARPQKGTPRKKTARLPSGTQVLQASRGAREPRGLIMDARCCSEMKFGAYSGVPHTRFPFGGEGPLWILGFGAPSRPDPSSGALKSTLPGPHTF